MVMHIDRPFLCEYNLPIYEYSVKFKLNLSFYPDPGKIGGLRLGSGHSAIQKQLLVPRHPIAPLTPTPHSPKNPPTVLLK